METKHTPTPWKNPSGSTRIESNDRWVASAHLDPESIGSEVTLPRVHSRNEAFANAALIVHRVNNYEALLEALKKIASCENVVS